METKKGDKLSFHRLLKSKKNTYTNSNFPCLVKYGEKIEDPDTTQTLNEKYNRIARNAFRHLTYGAPLLECKVISWLTFKALFIKRDLKLLKALRLEMQNIFYNAFVYLDSGTLNNQAIERLEIFIKNLLAVYPYLDPEDNEKVFLPAKINSQWEQIEFRFEKIDISPQTGLLAKLIEDEDRLYAYGIVSHDHSIKYLTLMGSHYLSGQGFYPNWIYNFTPGHSVGEGHDLTNIKKWLMLHPNAIITGHSKGGTLAMILSMLYPHLVKEANCLNPAPLCEKTAHRLNPTLGIQAETKPIVNIYIQQNDPVFLMGNKFPDGAFVYNIGKKNEIYSRLEAHANYFTGRKSITISSVSNNELEKTSKIREFVSDLKNAVNWIVFPALYLKFLHKLILRRLNRFYERNKTTIKVLIFAALIIICIAILATGYLSFLTVPIISYLGPTLGASLLTGSATTLLALTANALPKVSKLISDVCASCMLFGTIATIGIGAMVTAAFFSVCKLIRNAIFSWNSNTSSPAKNDAEIKTESALSTVYLTKKFKPSPAKTNEPNMQTEASSATNDELAKPKKLSDFPFLIDKLDNSELFSDKEIVPPVIRKKI